MSARAEEEKGGREKEEKGGGEKRTGISMSALMADGEADEGSLLQHEEGIGTRVHALHPTKGISLTG